MRFTLVLMLLSGLLCAQDSLWVRLDTLDIDVLPGQDLTGKNIQVLPQKITDLSQTFSSQLEQHTAINVRDYGAPGKASSVGLRGMSSSHTVFNWNGFNMNSLTLGSFDFGSVMLPTGGSLSVNLSPANYANGSGAIGGVIGYNVQPEFKKTKSFSLFSSKGWFDYRGVARDDFAFNDNYRFSGVVANEQWWINASYSLVNAANDFVSDQEEVFNEESFQQNALNFDVYRKLNKRHQVGVSFWGNESINEFQPNNFKAHQMDSNYRATFQWKYKNQNWKIHSSVGGFYHLLNYQSEDVNTGENAVDSRVLTKSFKGFSNASRRLLTKSKLIFGGFYNYDLAKVRSYGDEVIQQTGGVSARLNWLEWGGWEFSPALRLEGYSNYKPQMIKSFSVSRKNKKHRLQFNIEDKYRIPTFNDRFWNPGGNPNLEPEKGWGSDFNYLRKVAGKWGLLSSKTSVYSIVLRNWIQWIPTSNGYWSPVSYMEVWSRGVEQTVNWTKSFKNSKIGVKLDYSWTRSTIQELADGDTSDIGNQLIYVPKHNLNGSIHYDFKNWTITYRFSYTGMRETTADNVEVWSLEPYHLHHATVSYAWEKKQFTFTGFVRANNLLSQDYQMVRGQPLPGRFIEFGTILKFKSNK